MWAEPLAITLTVLCVLSIPGYAVKKICSLQGPITQVTNDVSHISTSAKIYIHESSINCKVDFQNGVSFAKYFIPLF